MNEIVEETKRTEDEEETSPGPADANDTSARAEKERVQRGCTTEHVPKIPKELVGGGCIGGGLH